VISKCNESVYQVDYRTKLILILSNCNEDNAMKNL